MKKENGKYYTIVNIKTSINELEKKDKEIGIDLGLKNLATLSDGQEITNLDLKREIKQIRKYQKKIIQTKIHEQKIPKNLKKIPQMDKQTKQ